MICVHIISYHVTHQYTISSLSTSWNNIGSHLYNLGRSIGWKMTWYLRPVHSTCLRWLGIWWFSMSVSWVSPWSIYVIFDWEGCHNAGIKTWYGTNWHHVISNGFIQSTAYSTRCDDSFYFVGTDAQWYRALPKLPITGALWLWISLNKLEHWDPKR